MVDQQNQELEQVFNYLCRNPVSSIDDISSHLNLSNNELTTMIQVLQSMGLNIEIVGNKAHLITETDIIDSDFIEKQIRKQGIEKKVDYHFITESTNLLAQNNKQDAIFISNYQSQGKGRQAKKWLSPLGQSIALSLSHRFNNGLQKLSGLNIAIGVAIAETLNHFGGQNIGLKWPNDVIGLKGKMAGILIEATGNSKQCRAIIGIGVNWSIQPELFQSVDQACSNLDLSDVSRTDFITKLISNIHGFIDEFNHNGLKKIQPIWASHDIYMNKYINLLQGSSIQTGKYKGINNDGLLLVEIGGELKTFASGEVSIRATTH